MTAETPAHGLQPLSLGQERLWFLEQLEPEAARYNVPVVLQIAGPLDTVRLERALRQVVRRHEMLRATIKDVDGVPLFSVAEDAHVPVRVHDSVANAGDLLDEVRLAVHRPLDLAGGGPLRAELWPLCDGTEFVLSLTLHHIVTDAQSLRVILTELGQAYEHGAVRAAAPDVSFGDYIAEERRRASEPDVLAALDERVALLKDALPPLLPGRLEQRAAPQPLGDVVSVTYTAEEVQQITAAAAAHGATQFMFLAALAEVTIATQAGRPRFIFVLPVSRRRAQQRGTVGFFIDTEVLVGDVSRAKRLPDVVADVRREVVRAISGPAIPLQLLVSRMREHGIVNWPDRLQLSIDLVRGEPTTMRWDDLDVTWLLDVSRDEPAFDLQVGWWTNGDGFGMSTVYDANAYRLSTAQAIVDGYSQLLAAALVDPSAPLAQLSRVATR